MSLGPESREDQAGRAPSGDEEYSPFQEEEIETFRRVVLKHMRKSAPHLYVVLKAWSDERALRGEQTAYRHGVGRGFYSRLAKQLGLERQSVLYRLRMAMKSAAELLNPNEQAKKN